MHNIFTDNKGYLMIDNITKDELDLNKTLNCGQAFRWHKEAGDYWVGVVCNKIWILKQYNNYITTNLKIEDKDKVISYFNLDMNYTDVIKQLDLNEFEKLAYEQGKGIHILRQDLLETMVTFLMSQCNTMRNIRNIINKLCRTYGTKLEEKYDEIIYTDYTFPSLAKLSRINETEFKQLSMGFRAEYLVKMLQRINKDASIVSRLKQCDYADAIRLLCGFDGIGIKVANCISLFALHHIEAFPVDVHIQKIIDSRYGGKLNIAKYHGYGGIIQQYMYYLQAIQ